MGELQQCQPPGETASPDCMRAYFELATALVFMNQDPDEGMSLWKAMAKNHADSKVAMGVCLVEGLGVSRDDDAGVRWLREGVEAGNAQAMFELATLMFTGEAGLDEDEIGAFELFLRGSEQQHASCLFMVGDCLLEGVGC